MIETMIVLIIGFKMVPQKKNTKPKKKNELLNSQNSANARNSIIVLETFKNRKNYGKW